MTSKPNKAFANASSRHDDTGNTRFKADLVALIPFLRAFSRSLCLNKSLAEDMAQTALVKAWQARSHFQMGTNLKAWLFTILRNEIATHFRRSWRQEQWDETAAGKIQAPRDEQDWSAELSDVSRAMQRLPLGQREALTLVGAGGFSYEEAASITGAELGTVKSRVARARVALLEILDSPEMKPSAARPAPGGALKEILTQLGDFSRARVPAGALRPPAREKVAMIPAFVAVKALRPVPAFC